jgi:HEAT repeat protein
MSVDYSNNNQSKSKSGRGGKRPGAGRPVGSVTPEKRLAQVTKAAIKELALQHAEIAINALLEIVRDKAHVQRVSAANALLDRGLGKPAQEIIGDPENPIEHAHTVAIEFIKPAH